MAWLQRTSGAGFTKRSQPGAALFDGKLWVVGGIKKILPIEYLGDVWKSSDLGATWSQATAAAPWSARAPRVVVHGGQLWVFGDNSSNYDIWRSSDGATWEFVAAPSILRRENYSATSFGGYLWVMGGWNFNAPGGLSRDIFRSTDGVTWEQIIPAGSYWTHRQLFGLQAWNGKLWVFGGQDSSGKRNDVWYSSNATSWTNVGGPIAWSQRIIEASCVVGDSLLIVGGDGNADMWHTVNGLAWTETDEDERVWSEPRYYPGVIGDSLVWVIGGQQASSGLVNDVWSYSTVGVTSRVRWDLIAPVGKSSRIRWKVNVDPVGVSSRIRWDIIAPVGKSSRIRWRVLSPPVGVTSKIRWQVLNATVGKTSHVRWKVTESVGLVSHVRWKVGPVCSEPYEFKVWGLSGSIARSADAEFMDCVA